MADETDRRNVKIAADLADAVDAAVSAGEYGSTDEAIGEALREWKERRENFGYTIKELRAIVQEGIDSGPSEPAEPFMEELRQRYEAMAIERASTGRP